MLSPSTAYGGTVRATSPLVCGFSTLTTSAPRSASSIDPHGPAPYCSTARTDIPSSGSRCGILRSAMVDASDYATKGDLAQLGGELSGAMQTLRGELRGEMAALRGEMQTLRGDVRREM